MGWLHSSMHLPAAKLDFVDKWPLANLNDLILILIAYLAFILKIGPSIMKDRQPYRLNSCLFVYNLFKVVNATFLAYKFGSYIKEKGLFPRECEHDAWTLHSIAVLYWTYMITKIMDLMDTIFFVLRKKYSQISFLHVYHHVFTVSISWFCLNYDPSDHWAFMAFTNCTIHIVMYIYYALASLGPTYAKYLWWKKYVTVMQLSQFVVVIAHVVLQTYTSQCPMQGATYCLGVGNLLFFICLFTDFYHKRYNAVVADKKNIAFECMNKTY